MSENRLNIQTESARAEMALAVLQTIRKQAADSGIGVTGQIVIQMPFQPPLPVFLCCKDDGGYMCWFIDSGNYCLFALVNDKIKHVITIPMDKKEEFQERLEEIQREMGE